MPLYLYACVDHGEFEKITPAARSADPRPCPTCDKSSPRQFCAVAVITDTSLFTEDRLDGGSRSGLADGTLIGNKFKKMADAAGVVTRGKQYLGGLARFPGDPEAWVSSRGDIKRIAEKNNFNVEGVVNRKAEAVAPAEKGLCEKVVKRYVDKAMAENPGANRENVIADVVTRHAPPGAKRILKKRPKARRGSHARG